jgi:uncharacterized membrane protein
LPQAAAHRSRAAAVVRSGGVPAPSHRPARTRHILSPERAVGRFVLSLAVGVVTFLVLLPLSVPWGARAMVAWDATAATLLIQTWSRLTACDAATTELRAADDDPGRREVFILAIFSSLFGFFGSTLLLRLARASTSDIWLIPALLSVALSWLLTHTEYTLRYAHLFYRGENNGGLEFPETKSPDDLDFAYYSFTIGMCFQVSDVQISSREIRRATLLHSVLSFAFNTTILALTVNIAAQLMDQ